MQRSDFLKPRHLRSAQPSWTVAKAAEPFTFAHKRQRPEGGASPARVTAFVDTLSNTELRAIFTVFSAKVPGRNSRLTRTGIILSLALSHGSQRPSPVIMAAGSVASTLRIQRFSGMLLMGQGISR